MNQLFTELRKGRKVALRLGALHDPGYWKIKQKKTKELLQKKIVVSDLIPGDVEWAVNQKQVDMKMGFMESREIRKLGGYQRKIF